MGDILKGLDMDVSLVPVKKIGCPCTVFGPSSKQPPRIVVVRALFFKDISYFGKNRISKNFGYRGATAQFFFALGEILANKKTLRKKSKICIFELKFFPVWSGPPYSKKTRLGCVGGVKKGAHQVLWRPRGWYGGRKCH